MKSSTKKTILIIIASIVGILLIAALGFLVYFKLQFKVYQDDQNKFSIRYPKTWTVKINPKKTVAVVFLRPKDTALDTFRGNFSVVIQPVPDDILTLDAYTAAIKRQMSIFKKSLIVNDDKSIHWGWREGHEWIVEILRPAHFKMVSAWVLKGGQAYILTFTGDVDKYSGDFLNVQEMIHSLQLQE